MALRPTGFVSLKALHPRLLTRAHLQRVPPAIEVRPFASLRACTEPAEVVTCQPYVILTVGKNLYRDGNCRNRVLKFA